MKLGRVKPIIFEIPFTPPSVNHYKKPITLQTSNGPVHSYSLTAEAKAFRDAIVIFSRGHTLIPPTEAERNEIRYSLTATVFLGRHERGDGDNFWKCIADGLVAARVIHSDARVRSWHIDVEDGDRFNPRTLICVGVTERERTIAERMRDQEEGESGYGSKNI